MYEPYSNDDNYNDDYYNHDNNNDTDKFKWYFKFDVDKSKSLSDWVLGELNDFLQKDKWTIDNTTGLPTIKFPVGGSSDTANNIKLQYLGSNYQGAQIWKTKYFINSKMDDEYRKHIAAHVKHFLLQPHYYGGMFDILN